MDVEQIGEHRIIERIYSRVYREHKDILLGIGDDCASVKFAEDDAVLITTDSLLEDIHFDLQKTAPFQLGWKAMAVNFSDIAAMGGIPRFVSVSLGLPSSLSVEFIDKLYDGMQMLCMQYNASIVGGNISASKRGFFISVTVLGAVEKGAMIKRSGAKKGDAIFVTGAPGDSAIGLELLQIDSRYKNKSVFDAIMPETEGFDIPSDRLVSKHLMPVPRVKEGAELAENHAATSMIDLSDGLAAGIKEICGKSGTGVRIYERDLPLSKEAKKIAMLWGKNVIDYALYGGEDYELLFTAKRGAVGRLSLKGIVHEIGEITDKKEGIKLVHKDNTLSEIVRGGYEHFAKE